MRAASKFGIVTGLAVGVLAAINMPLLWAAFFTVMVVDLTLFAAITYGRTRMTWVAMGALVGATWAAVWVPLSFGGYTPTAAVVDHPVLFFGPVAIVILIQLVGKRVDRVKWTEWQRHMASMSVGDMIRFRHIPRWR